MIEDSQTGKGPLYAGYGPWALVTGASDGIGRAIAGELARQGLSLVLVARRRGALEELAQGLNARYRTQARVLVADLSSPSEVARVDVETRDLDIGLLVASAGYGGSGPFVDASQESELGMIDVNCRALAQSAQDFARRFVARGRGGLVLMSSVVAFQGVPRAANYAATKAYVQTLAEGLAVELKDKGVEVLASAPGPVVTGFGARSGMKIARGQTPEEVALGTLRALGRRTTVRPGFLAKALEAALAPLPRPYRVRVMGRVMAGMTNA
ncbi:MAG TPA: SDR family NAD(P)-dependent oxidoreductase [Rhodoblastus sp.]|nr:SDR family NAD(P)-dependent oxidoreductase [Rhodoblastus sp.]